MFLTARSTANVADRSAASHRALEATESLEEAVRALREEGLRIRLDLLERRSNAEVRRAVLDGDIVAEQFLGGYGLFATEGMSAGKPVLSNMSWMSDDLRRQIADCPIVDATRETLRDRLRTLVTDPALRQQLGRESREYVLRRHSYTAIGERWAELIAAVWAGEFRPAAPGPPPATAARRSGAPEGEPSARHAHGTRRRPGRRRLRRPRDARVGAFPSSHRSSGPTR